MLMEEVKAVFFEKDELEYRKMSQLKVLLPLLCSQDSNSDVEIKFHDI